MRYLLSLSLLVLALTANARQITSDEALVAAQDFFNNSAVEKSRAPRAVRARALNTAQSEDTAPYYIFNASDDNGFVIIGGDDKLPQILGYSYIGSFNYDLFIQQCPSFSYNVKKRIAQSTHSKGTFYTNTSSKKVLPLIKTTWGQGAPYNYFTPILSDGNHCATGCVNTAQAQIMKFWEYPSVGKGTVSYEWNNQILSHDFSTEQYQWSQMLDNYDNGFSEVNANSVAALMRDCGYANNTSYSDESGASIHYDAFVRNFGYDKAIRIIDRHLCNEAYFESVMREELDAGRPFFVGGRQQEFSGVTAHAFICDGYDENGYFHFNLGWNGANDGYYLPSIGWNIDYIEIGIQPDCGGIPTLTFGSKYDFKYEDGKIFCELCIYNPFGIFYDSYGEIYNEIATIAENTSTHEIYTFTKRKGTDFYILYDMPLPSDLPDGNYLIYPALKFADGGWNKFTFFDERQEDISLLVQNGIYKYTNPNITDKLDSGKIEVDGIYYIINDDYTATVTYKNDKYNSYKGCVTIPNTISYNGEDYHVIELGIDAFRDCLLDELVIGNNITTINEGALSCSLHKLIFSQPSNLREIIGWGFNNCNVPSIDLPYGVESIGKCAFQNISAKSVDIPQTVTDMAGGMAFNACLSLESIYVHWTNELDLPMLHPYDHIFNLCNWGKINLYVPNGSSRIYFNNPQWNDLNIIEYDDSGIHETYYSVSDANVNIYNLQGIKVFQGNASDNPTLPGGVYLKQIGNKVIKVVIKE